MSKIFTFTKTNALFFFFAFFFVCFIFNGRLQVQISWVNRELWMDIRISWLHNRGYKVLKIKRLENHTMLHFH